MTKVAEKPPREMRTAVKINDNEYELWHAAPVYLGKLKRVGRHWFTEDQKRHVSSRDALDYLIDLRKLRGEVPSVPQGVRVPPTPWPTKSPGERGRLSHRETIRNATTQTATTPTIPPEQQKLYEQFQQFIAMQQQQKTTTTKNKPDTSQAATTRKKK